MAWELFYLCNYKEKAIIMVHIRKRNVSWKDGSGGRDVYVLFSTKLHNDSRSFLMTQESKRKQIIISLFWQILQCQKQQTWPCLLSVALFFFIVPFFSSLSELERRRRRRSKKVHWPENGLFVRPSETQTISKIGQLYPSFLLGFYAPFSKKTFFLSQPIFFQVLNVVWLMIWLYCALHAWIKQWQGSHYRIFPSYIWTICAYASLQEIVLYLRNNKLRTVAVHISTSLAICSMENTILFFSRIICFYSRVLRMFKLPFFIPSLSRTI